MKINVGVDLHDIPWAKCSALTCLPPGVYGASMSRNSAINFTADSERISIDFINDIMSVVRNYTRCSKGSTF